MSREAMLVGPTGELHVVYGMPTCTICDGDEAMITDPDHAFVLHTGQPVCGNCVREYKTRDIEPEDAPADPSVSPYFTQQEGASP